MPLSFYPLAWLLFLFCWLVFEVLRIWILTGGFLYSPSKGLNLVFPSVTVRAADLAKLDAGIPLEKLAVDPSRDRYVILEIKPSGRVSFRGHFIDLDQPIPWAKNSREARDTLVFVRPLPGVTYGSVVTVLDQLRSQGYFWDLEVNHIFLTKCEPDPSPNTSFQRTLRCTGGR